MCKQLGSCRSSSRRLQALAGLLLGLLLAVAGAASAVAAEKGAASGDKAQKTDFCVECHRDQRFLVQNKKLYDYFQAWTLSLHQQEGVACADCHGGNPNASTKAAAHGGEAMRSSQATSPINYQNIPGTCAKCHETIYEEFRQSEHYKHLKVAKQEQQGPNCVTCHGSLNVQVLNVTNVRNTCQKCHNQETDNSPEIPGEAEVVLNNFLSINRYYRFIVSRSSEQDARAFSQVVDPVIKRLNAEWHTFDIDEIDKKTHDLVQFMKVRRNELLEAARRKRK
jgi:nitrate/TMAO reductase-like tetraheme cytochrome c subunit